MPSKKKKSVAKTKTLLDCGQRNGVPGHPPPVAATVCSGGDGGADTPLVDNQTSPPHQGKGINEKRYMTRVSPLNDRPSLSQRCPGCNVNKISCQSSSHAKRKKGLVGKHYQFAKPNQFAETSQIFNPAVPSENDQAQVFKSPVASSVLINSKENFLTNEQFRGEKHDCVSATTGFEYTKFAEMLTTEQSDEVASDVDPSFVNVRDYRVKKEHAPLLRLLMLKYGDMAKDCSVVSQKIRSTLLEEVCSIYLKLEKSDLSSLNKTAIKNLISDLAEFERLNVKVGWLCERLEEISQAKEVISSYAAMKEQRKRNREEAERKRASLQVAREKSHQAELELAAFLVEVERKKTEVEVLQGNVLLLEKEKGEIDSKDEKIYEKMLDARGKMSLFKKTLVHGLLPSNGWIDEA